jgi:MFS family permease
VWLSQTTPNERRALLAAYAGYGLDGFDFMVYSFIIPTLISIWGLSKAEASYIASGALVASAIGGWAAGVLADRYGRVRILQLTVLWFAVFTFLSGFTQGFGQLFFTRAMQGLGFGGEWSVGSVLVAEIIDARHRGKAAGLVQSSWSVGWAGAAMAFWAVNLVAPPQLAWRIVMWLGLAPVFFAIYIRRQVREPEVFLANRAARGRQAGKPQVSFLDIFRGPLRRTTVLATLLSTGMLAGYYSITIWLPTYLATERHLSLDGTTGYLMTVIVGSLVGYLSSAWLTDVIGRRRGFMLFAVCASLLIVLYTHLPLTGGSLIVGFALGFFILGIFSGMGAFLTELYPGSVRGSGQGFTYSMGRGLGGFCPSLIGIASTRMSLGDAIMGFSVAAYALVVVTAWVLPETRGKVLDADAEGLSARTTAR